MDELASVAGLSNPRSHLLQERRTNADTAILRLLREASGNVDSCGRRLGAPAGPVRGGQRRPGRGSGRPPADRLG